MGMIENEDTFGYSFNGKIVCYECAINEERNAAKEDEIITDRDREDR